MSVALFLDAQQYLDLFRLASGRKLLDPIEEQKDHIFVTAQIADEVLRNKLIVAREFLSAHRKQLNPISSLVPDLLFEMSEGEVRDLTKTLQRIKERLAKHSDEALRRISRSEDGISRRLGEIFGEPARASPDEMKRARERRETGNPPGKARDTLGDQITWEQLLTYCQADAVKQLWIISGDEDYGVKEGDSLLLNARLHDELVAAAPEITIHAFSDLLAGIKHFGEHAGVRAEKLPTPKEAAEIRKEIDALPPSPTQWYSGSDLAAIVDIQNARLRRGVLAPFFTHSALGTPRTLLSEAESMKGGEEPTKE